MGSVAGQSFGYRWRQLLMSPVKLYAARLQQLWKAREFLRGEVAFLCALRPELRGGGGRQVCGQLLQMGGSFSCLVGSDGEGHGATFAATFPQRNAPPEVLIRIELGAPSESVVHPACSVPLSALCRVAIRSASPLVSSMVSQVVQTLLCDPDLLGWVK